MEAYECVIAWDAGPLSSSRDCLLRSLWAARPDPGVRTVSAFGLADRLSVDKFDDSWYARRLAALASNFALPVSPALYEPAKFIKICKDRNLPPRAVDEFFAASRECVLLRSRQGFLRCIASGLRAWGKFCVLLGEAHFPVNPSRVVQFACVCRDAGTFGQYLSHIKLGCELTLHPTDWWGDHRLRRARDGIKKGSFVFKGPKLGVSGEMLLALVANAGIWIPERFFCVLSWVFLLRARSEASALTRARPSVLSDRFNPVPVNGIGVVGDRLVIRLRSRKNKVDGDTIVRSCVCAGGADVSARVPSTVCPVRVLWPWIESRCEVGDRLFSDNIANRAQSWLQVALSVRGVACFSKYTLHSLRRGAAQALVEKGGGLATLLKAGSWRSSAFKTYLDFMGLEDSVVRLSVQSLLDIDEEDAI